MLGDLQKDKDFSARRVAKRLEQGTNRNDFVSPILRCVSPGKLTPGLEARYEKLIGCRANDEKGMTVPEIESSFNIIIVAGTHFLLPLPPPFSIPSPLLQPLSSIFLPLPQLSSSNRPTSTDAPSPTPQAPKQQQPSSQARSTTSSPLPTPSPSSSQNSAPHSPPTRP